MYHRLFCAFLLLQLPGLALANELPQKYFGLMGNFIDPDSSRFTNEEGLGFDFLVGRELQPWLFVEFRGTAEVHETGAGRGSDNYRGAGGVDLQFLLGQRGKFSLFAVGGGGYAFNDLAGTRNDEGAIFGNIGAGLLSRELTNANLRLRIEARARYEDFGPGMTDYRIGFGIEVPIDPTELVVREVPVATPAAEAAPAQPQPGRYPARPVDTDQDGVIDYFDRCPGTPEGTLVDEAGCKAKFQGDNFTLEGVVFASGSDQLTPSAQKILDQVAESLRRHPAKTVTVSGHTDSQGSAESNLVLSLARANSVKRYLTQRGVAAKRLKAAGYGESVPVASNDTAAGRAKNRRVEFSLQQAFDPK